MSLALASKKIDRDDWTLTGTVLSAKRHSTSKVQWTQLETYTNTSRCIRRTYTSTKNKSQIIPCLGKNSFSLSFLRTNHFIYPARSIRLRHHTRYRNGHERSMGRLTVYRGGDILHCTRCVQLIFLSRFRVVFATEISEGVTYGTVFFRFHFFFFSFSHTLRRRFLFRPAGAMQQVGETGVAFATMVSFTFIIFPLLSSRTSAHIVRLLMRIQPHSHEIALLMMASFFSLLLLLF